MDRSITIPRGIELGGGTTQNTVFSQHNENNMAFIRCDTRNTEIAEKFGQVVFLPYNQGKISYVKTDKSVLSGPFTGCIMSCFQIAGSRYVAHVHTSGGNDDCKREILNLMDSGFCTGDKYHFKPYTTSLSTLFGKRDLATIFEETARGCGRPHDVVTFGLISGITGYCYTILCVRDKSNRNKYNIHFIKQTSQYPQLTDFPLVSSLK